MLKQVQRAVTGITIISALTWAECASALPIVFTPDSGVGGTGGSTFNIGFNLDPFADLSSVTISLALNTYDQNFTVDVNGTEVVPIDNNNPAVFTPAVATPWNANSNSLPRLLIELSSSGVAFSGTTSTGAGSLVPLTYAQATVAPAFMLGANTIELVNPDATGPDGIDWSISGEYSQVPAPFTAALFGIGLVLLGRRRGSANR